MPGEHVIHTRLDDDTAVCIRPITAADEIRMREGIARMSDIFHMASLSILMR